MKENNSSRREQHVDSTVYNNNYDRIFGTDAEREARIAKQDTERAERRRSARGGAAIISDIEPFKSPIDGSVITSRSQLRDHNKRHGVTDSRDYSDSYIANKRNQRERECNGDTHQARHERVEALKRTMREKNYG